MHLNDPRGKSESSSLEELIFKLEFHQAAEIGLMLTIRLPQLTFQWHCKNQDDICKLVGEMNCCLPSARMLQQKGLTVNNKSYF